MFLVVLVAYTGWSSPFELALVRAASRAHLVADLAADAFFCADIVVSFFVAYRNTSTDLLVDDRSKIAARYLTRPGFVMDVASTIPLQIIYQLMGGKRNGPCGFLILLRLWRLRRASKLFARLEKDIRFGYFWTRFIKLICVTLFALHCASCVYLWFAYTYAVYWSMTTMAMVGNGDLHAANTSEELFSIFFMLCNMGLACYVIGNMTNLVVHGATNTFFMRDMVDRVASYGKTNRLPVWMREQMVEHVQLRFQMAELLQEEVLSELPKAVRSAIAQHLYKATVEGCYLFRGLSDNLVVQLVSEMKAEFFPPKVDIVLENELPTDCYIIVYGQVEALTTAEDGTEKYLGSLKVQMEDLTFSTDLRVVIHEQSSMASCRSAGKLVYLPGSLEELMKVGEEKFGKAATRVLTADGAEVDDVRALRDGDHLFLS
ncbi:hypothetical protein ACQ4PT_022098 [Festuca glaucescens]